MFFFLGGYFVKRNVVAMKMSTVKCFWEVIDCVIYFRWYVRRSWASLGARALVLLSLTGEILQSRHLVLLWCSWILMSHLKNSTVGPWCFPGGKKKQPQTKKPYPNPWKTDNCPDSEGRAVGCVGICALIAATVASAVWLLEWEEPVPPLV